MVAPAMEPESLADIRRMLDECREALAAQQRTIDSIPDLGRAVAGLAARIGELERYRSGAARIPACEAWITAEPPSNMLVSVVMPTRDRSRLLARAIASVQAQTHANWELLVVDDASSDDTAAVVGATNDPRVRLLTSDGTGDARARNVALDNARGDAVAYLDDDNRMFPVWLAAVAWAFEHHPKHDALYGARVHETISDSLPELQFEIMEPADLRTRNPLDTNVLAHRRSAPEARWDERLMFASDWELTTRLAADRPLLPLPVRAVLYSTSAPGRRSLIDRGDDYDEIRRRAADLHDQSAGARPPISSG
jgi:Glycosyl transferase family 2